MLVRLLASLIGVLIVFHTHAAVDPYVFSSEEQAVRYQTFIEELRCPKCKNNNLAGTNSQVAIDLRRELQKMVVAGDSDEQIIEFMVSRYGDFVLYRPRMQGKTLFVWIGPFIFMGVGALAVFAIVRHRRRFASSPDAPELSEEELQQFDALLAADANSTVKSNRSNKKNQQKSK